MKRLGIILAVAALGIAPLLFSPLVFTERVEAATMPVKSDMSPFLPAEPEQVVIHRVETAAPIPLFVERSTVKFPPLLTEFETPASITTVAFHRRC